MQYHLNGFRPGDPDRLPPAPEPWRDARHQDVPDSVDVLIAGCGPAGLCLAAQLARFAQVRTMIVEPKSGPMEKGQADGINLRSMEMFQAFGFAHKVKREALWINETTFWTPDPANPGAIHRVGRVQDVEDGLSEMPHVLLNQARVHDLYLDFMRQAPSRLTPDYGLRVADLTIAGGADDSHPVTVTLERTDPARAGQTHTVRARYVVGCDGARSAVRRAIGGTLHGDAAHQAWGVMDILAVTDFPDIRMKCIIRSGAGNILVLPREGGYLLRLYVELDKLDPAERVADRGLGVDDIIAQARRVFAPYEIQVKDVVWWSIYEIGHRLTDKFDDVPPGADARRTPRVFTAGDACHTHSPKAGQGMNVSMGDTFNLGWKLISVLTGRSDPSLLHSYSHERRAAAQGLVEYDHAWSRIVSARDPDNTGDTMPAFQRQFIAGGRFTAGLTIDYQRSSLVGAKTHQDLARGFEIGQRFHSAPVIRLADARPMSLGDVVEAGITWHVFAFAGADDTTLDPLCEALATDPASPLTLYRRPGDEADTLISLNAVLQGGFRDRSIMDVHPILRPAKGRFGLTDYEKVFCAELKSGQDIFDRRRIDRKLGCMVVVRPDQHVAHVLPLTSHRALGRFFAGVFTPA